MKNILITIAAVVLVGCATSNEKLVKAAEEGNIEIVKHLLEAGADVNATDKFGGRPLGYAIAGGHQKIVELLINSE